MLLLFIFLAFRPWATLKADRWVSGVINDKIALLLLLVDNLTLRYGRIDARSFFLRRVEILLLELCLLSRYHLTVSVDILGLSKVIIGVALLKRLFSRWLVRSDVGKWELTDLIGTIRVLVLLLVLLGYDELFLPTWLLTFILMDNIFGKTVLLVLFLLIAATLENRLHEATDDMGRRGLPGHIVLRFFRLTKCHLTFGTCPSFLNEEEVVAELLLFLCSRRVLHSDRMPLGPARLDLQELFVLLLSTIGSALVRVPPELLLSRT